MNQIEVLYREWSEGHTDSKYVTEIYGKIADELKEKLGFQKV